MIKKCTGETSAVLSPFKICCQLKIVLRNHKGTNWSLRVSSLFLWRWRRRNKSGDNKCRRDEVVCNVCFKVEARFDAIWALGKAVLAEIHRANISDKVNWISQSVSLPPEIPPSSGGISICSLSSMHLRPTVLMNSSRVCFLLRSSLSRR